MSLTQKILAFVGALVLGLLATTLTYTTVQANRLARESVQEALTETTGTWETFQADRYEKLTLGLRALANEPAFKALIETRDPTTINDTLVERGADFGADLFLVTDPSGVVIGRSFAGDEGSDLSRDPLVTRALEGAEAATIWRQRDTLFHAVSVPMATLGKLQGVLIAAFALDEKLAADLRKLTRSEIVFFTRDGERSVLAASTLPGEATALRSAGERFGNQATSLKLSAGQYVAVAVPLKAATGELVGSLAALRSLDQEMAPFRRFRNSLVVASLLVLLAGMAAAFGVAKGITRPVRRLASLVDRVRDGSYTGAVEVASADEIGTLARAFNGLMADLREKEQMIAFLREGASLRRNTLTTTVEAVGAPTEGTLRAAAGDGLFAARYQILETLGRGGMGVVYKAHDRQLDEIVALKTLRPDILLRDPGLLERFKQELKLARRITHKNVLRTYDFGEDRSTPYISMEYVAGVTLKELVADRGALPLSVGMRVAKEMCHGLEAAHEQGVIHRDIKSRNMMIIPATGELKIMDFGIARHTDVGAEEGLTLAGTVLGTPDYMPPEQAEGRPADFRSDIYCLGVVLFEAFVGRLPFAGTNALATITQHIEEPPPRPRKFNPAIPASLERIILRCLAKEPGERYPSVGALLDDLDLVSTSEST